MNKQAHIMLSIFDLLSFWVLWIGYSEFQRIPLEISNQVDMIRFGNRMGFFSMGLAIPIFHIIALVGQFWADIPKKIISIVNIGIYALLAVLIIAGFAGSSWLTSQVENAGYVYCRRLSGAGAVSKTLVYTKDMKICEDLVEKKKKRPRAKYKK